MDVRFSHLSTFALYTALCASLILGGGGNNVQAAQKTDIFKTEKIAPRSVDPAQALQALSALCLEKPGAGIVTWETRTGKAGNYVFENVTIRPSEKDTVNVGKLEINGVHMDGEAALFDSMAFTDVSIEDGKQGIKIKTFDLVKPSISFAQTFCAGEDAASNLAADFAFGGYSASGIAFDFEGLNMQIETVQVSMTADEVNALLKGYNLVTTGENANKISIDSLGIYGFDYKPLQDWYKILATQKTELKEQESDDASDEFIEAITEFKAITDGAQDAVRNVSFREVFLSGLTFENDQTQMQMDNLKFGLAEDKTGMFSLKGFNSLTTEEGEDIAISMGSIDVDGFNIEKYKNMYETIMARVGKENGSDADSIKFLQQYTNPYNPDFRNASAQDIRISFGGLEIDLQETTTTSSLLNGKLTTVHKTSPLTITLPEASDNKDLIEWIETMDIMGYKSLVVSMAQTTVSDEAADSIKITDGYIALKDGFKLHYSSDISGFRTFMDKIVIAMDTKIQDGDAANPLDSAALLEDLKFNGMGLAFTDQSIIERGFKLAAKEQNVEVEAMKAQTILGLGLLEIMAQDETQKRLAKELGAKAAHWK